MNARAVRLAIKSAALLVVALASGSASLSAQAASTTGQLWEFNGVRQDGTIATTATATIQNGASVQDAGFWRSDFGGCIVNTSFAVRFSGTSVVLWHFQVDATSTCSGITIGWGSGTGSANGSFPNATSASGTSRLVFSTPLGPSGGDGRWTARRLSGSGSTDTTLAVADQILGLMAALGGLLGATGPTAQAIGIAITAVMIGLTLRTARATPRIIKQAFRVGGHPRSHVASTRPRPYEVSAPSSPATLTGPFPGHLAVRDLRLVIGNQQVVLDWNAPETQPTDDPLVGYRIYRIEYTGHSTAPEEIRRGAVPPGGRLIFVDQYVQASTFNPWQDVECYVVKPVYQATTGQYLGPASNVFVPHT